MQNWLRETEIDLKQSRIKLGTVPRQPNRPFASKTTALTPPLNKNQPSSLNGGSGHPVSGTELTAVKTVAYNDFIDLLPGLKVKPETRGDVIPGTGDRKTSATHNSTIESFDLWVEA